MQYFLENETCVTTSIEECKERSDKKRFND
jgi:hypothetical protein